MAVSFKKRETSAYLVMDVFAVWFLLGITVSLFFTFLPIEFFLIEIDLVGGFACKSLKFDFKPVLNNNYIIRILNLKISGKNLFMF